MRIPRLLAGCAVAGAALLTTTAELAQRDPGPLVLAGHTVGRLFVHGGTASGLPVTGAPGADSPPGQMPAMAHQDRHQVFKELLTLAAQRHGLDPGLVEAVAWWESGWDMSKVSETGAVGLMQIDPATARDLAPKLLHRQVDVHNAFDNADLGAAVLKADIDDAGGNLKIALASYYEGAGNVDPSNLDPGAQTYVDGVTGLQREFDAGKDPAAPTPTP